MLGDIFRAAVNVVKLPISAAADIVTLGGTATDRDSYLLENLEEIAENLDDVTK